jgi:hypothetical protein
MIDEGAVSHSQGRGVRLRPGSVKAVPVAKSKSSSKSKASGKARARA